MTFEIHSKAKLNLIQKHLNNSLKLGNDTRTSKWKDAVKLPKLEIAKFDGEVQQSGSLLSTHLTQPLNRRTLGGVKKFNYLRCFWIVKPPMSYLDSASLMRTIKKRWIC